MIDVALYVDMALRSSLDGNSVEFNEAFNVAIQKVIDLRIVRGMSKTSSAITFQIGAVRPTDKWFVGAFSINKILEGYYTAFVLGRLAIGSAKDFILMERQAQEIYTDQFIRVDDIHDRLVYNTAVDRLPVKPIVWTLGDFKEPS